MHKSCGNCAVIFWWRKNVEKKAVEKDETTLKKKCQFAASIGKEKSENLLRRCEGISEDSGLQFLREGVGAASPPPLFNRSMPGIQGNDTMEDIQ